MRVSPVLIPAEISKRARRGSGRWGRQRRSRARSRFRRFCRLSSAHGWKVSSRDLRPPRSARRAGRALALSPHHSAILRIPTE